MDTQNMHDPGTMKAWTRVLPGGEWLGEYAPVWVNSPKFGTTTIHFHTKIYEYEEEDELEFWEVGTQVRATYNSEKEIFVLSPIN